MASLTAAADVMQMAIEPGDESPFYSRAYGGFTSRQLTFALESLKALPKRVLDPYSGQGFHLGRLSWIGCSVELLDLNPAVLFLAALRSPAALVNARELEQRLCSFLPARADPRPRQVQDTWLSEEVASGLRTLGSGLGLPPSESMLRDPRPDDDLQAALVGLVVLAARRLTALTASDNKTWPKEGGLSPAADWSTVLTEATGNWRRHAAAVQQRVQLREAGSLRTRLAPAALSSDRPPAHTVITSPPYANRLDYTQMWAPELAVARALLGDVSPSDIKATMTGTTVVRDREIEGSHLAELPGYLRASLERIRDDPEAYAGRRYYFPFFAHYFIDLASDLRRIQGRVRPGGTIVVFVRDTVRKDTLLETGRFVVDALTREGRGEVLRTHEVTVRSHVGLLSKGRRQAGRLGLAQREWWIAVRSTP